MKGDISETGNRTADAKSEGAYDSLSRDENNYRDHISVQNNRDLYLYKDLIIFMG